MSDWAADFFRNKVDAWHVLVVVVVLIVCVTWAVVTYLRNDGG